MKTTSTTHQARLRLPGSAAPANSSHDTPNVMQPPKPLRRILTGIALASAVLGLSQAAPIAVSSYAYDANAANGDAINLNWGDAGNVKLTDGVIPSPTGYDDPAHAGFWYTPPSPQITFDLGSIQSLGAVNLSYWADGSATYFGPRNDLGDRLSISVSDDNSTYSTPVSYSPFTGPLGQEVTTSMDVTGKSGRYVRLTFQNRADLPWMWLSEVSFDSTFVPPPSYTLTYTPGPNGSITGTSPQTVAKFGDGTAVTAVADSGYHFVKWSDDVMTASRTDLVVTADITVTANFAANTSHTLTYNAGSHGSITGTSPQTVAYGVDGAEVSAVADSGFHFVRWSDNSTANPRKDLAVTADLTVTAYFSAITITAADSYPLNLYAGAGWGNPPADAISATDLMDASQSTFSSITDNTTPKFGTANTAMNDGLNYPFTCYDEGGGFTVTFDTSVHTAGYDISSIISYSANQDPADRISQKYDLEYHVVGGGVTWTLLSGDPGATVDRLFTGSHANNGVDIGGTMAVTISGLSLTGVDQLRFTTHKNSCADPMEFLFTEIDVLGTATAASTPYDTWGNGTFAHSFTDKDPSHDPDGDGMTNQQEFAFGLDPTTGASVDPVTQQLDKATGKFRYTRTAASGLTYTVWTSENLKDWTKDLTATAGQADKGTVGGVQTVEVTITDPSPVGGKLFVRVQAE